MERLPGHSPVNALAMSRGIREKQKKKKQKKGNEHRGTYYTFSMGLSCSQSFPFLFLGERERERGKIDYLSRFLYLRRSKRHDCHLSSVFYEVYLFFFGSLILGFFGGGALGRASCWEGGRGRSPQMGGSVGKVSFSGFASSWSDHSLRVKELEIATLAHWEGANGMG